MNKRTQPSGLWTIIHNMCPSATHRVAFFLVDLKI